MVCPWGWPWTLSFDDLVDIYSFSIIFETNLKHIVVILVSFLTPEDIDLPSLRTKTHPLQLFNH